MRNKLILSCDYFVYYIKQHQKISHKILQGQTNILEAPRELRITLPCGQTIPFFTYNATTAQVFPELVPKFPATSAQRCHKGTVSLIRLLIQ